MKESDQPHINGGPEGSDISSVDGSLHDITVGQDTIRIDGTNQLGESYTEISSTDGAFYVSGEYSRTELSDGTIVENDSQGAIIYSIDGGKTIMNTDGSQIYISPSGDMITQTQQQVQDVIDQQGGVAKVLGLDDLSTGR